MIVQRYLVVNAMTGEARTTKRLPRVGFGEVVYRLRVDVPDRWGQVLGDIDLHLPEPPLDAVTVSEVST